MQRLIRFIQIVLIVLGVSTVLYALDATRPAECTGSHQPQQCEF